jgi:hypothetical protein
MARRKIIAMDGTTMIVTVIVAMLIHFRADLAVIALE